LKAITIELGIFQPSQTVWSVDSTSVTELVPYWATATTVLDDQTVAVAGKRQKKTVLEVWGVALPPVITPVGGGTASFAASVAVTSRTVLLSLEEPGKDIVKWMVKNRGKPHAMFLQFSDSGDVYELDYSDLTNPVLTQILSGGAGGSLPHTPELNSLELNCVVGSDHTQEGYTYVVFQDFEDQWQDDPNPIGAFTLFDHDRDGVIDDWGDVNAQAAALGLHDESQYVEYALRSVIDIP
jgi:hypothetical protein